MGKLFKTGWQRKPRDGNGRIITTQTQNHDTVEKKNEGSVVESVKDVVKEVVKDGKEALKKVEVVDVVPGAVKDATPAL